MSFNCQEDMSCVDAQRGSIGISYLVCFVDVCLFCVSVTSNGDYRVMYFRKGSKNIHCRGCMALPRPYQTMQTFAICLEGSFVTERGKRADTMDWKVIQQRSWQQGANRCQAEQAPLPSCLDIAFPVY